MKFEIAELGSGAEAIRWYRSLSNQNQQIYLAMELEWEDDTYKNNKPSIAPIQRDWIEDHGGERSFWADLQALERQTDVEEKEVAKQQRL